MFRTWRRRRVLAIDRVVERAGAVARRCRERRAPLVVIHLAELQSADEVRAWVEFETALHLPLGGSFESLPPPPPQ